MSLGDRHTPGKAGLSFKYCLFKQHHRKVWSESRAAELPHAGVLPKQSLHPHHEKWSSAVGSANYKSVLCEPGVSVACRHVCCQLTQPCCFEQEQKHDTMVSQHHMGEITLFSFKECFDPAIQEHAKLFSARFFLCPRLSVLIHLSGRFPLGFSGSLARTGALQVGPT